MKRCLCVFLLLSPITLIAKGGEKQLTVQAIYGSSTFSWRGPAGVQWTEGGKAYSSQKYDSVSRSVMIERADVTTGDRRTIVKAADLMLNPSDPPFRFTRYKWAPDGGSILFVSAPPEQQYLSRLTPAGNFYLYNPASKSFRRLTNVEEPQYNEKFSPDGSQLAFVRENNIRIMNLSTGTETPLTTDGTEHVINGKFDWVYEEEFGISDGFQWSPDGSMIAFWQLDETRIPEFHLIDLLSMRSDVTTMRYPKAGDPNSIVRIGVAHVKTGRIVWMDIGTDDNVYIPRIQWTPDGKKLAIQRLNRLQNHLEILSADPATGKSAVFFADTDSTWIDEKYALRYVNQSGDFLWISERDGFSHVYLQNARGGLIRQLTNGAWDVDDIAGVDAKRGVVYVTGRKETPLELHLYAVPLKGGNAVRVTGNGFTHSISMSPDAGVFLDWYSNASTPTLVSLNRSDGSAIRTIDDRSIPALGEYALGRQSFFQFRTSDGVTLNGSMLTPPGFDPARKYPVLFNVYGGPGSQTVSNSWGGSGYLWSQLMAEKGYIVVSVDGRGTGNRGKAFKSVVYRKLGTWEVHDQIEGAKYLSTLPYVDPSRIGIWGWSYGGYMAALTILKGASTFKCAVAVAPVTDWKFYDTIYTERYMGLPSDNVEGYRVSSPIAWADSLKGKLLIVHGTTDDNVHWQNTANLVDALQKAGKQFETMFYVNRNHGIGGGNTRVHLFNMITDYFLTNL